MQSDRKREKHHSGMFLPIGIALGTGVGALLGNIGVGIVLGVALGTLISLLAYYLFQDE